MRERGYDVVGLDASPTLIAAARDEDPDGAYVVGVAESLPFAADTFELVVAYNSLMDVADMPAGVSEAARVLRGGGRFCSCVTHPVRARGHWETRGSTDVHVLEHAYFTPLEYRAEVARDGLEFTFESRSYPLYAYSTALEQAGLLIEALREPEGIDEHDRFLPEFLLIRALKP